MLTASHIATAPSATTARFNRPSDRLVVGVRLVEMRIGLAGGDAQGKMRLGGLGCKSVIAWTYHEMDRCSPQSSTLNSRLIPE